MSRERHRSDGGTLKGKLMAMGNPAIPVEAASSIKASLMGPDLGPLPLAEQQVNAIATLYGPANSVVYVGDEATEDRAKSEAPNYSILHFATHGVLNDASPMYSQIVLARAKDSTNDGLLEAWEIMKLSLKADLVVLSACETARGRVSPGEGVIGLSWAFFVAGCPSTLVSQWKVPANSTTELMVEFHKNLLAGMTKAQALRSAELKLLRSGESRDPFYWAGFVVIGHGG
jgi:CHAT domain-containing protein